MQFVSIGAIDNKSALFKEMAWRLLGAKPLPDTVCTQI